MSWTDERIEELRKLWADGLSASQIASTLGGVSRNAVIGKIHRLGLSGRVKAQGRSAPRRTPMAPREHKQTPTPPAPPTAAQPRVMAVGTAVVKVVEREAYVPAPVPEPAPAPMLAEVVPLRGGATLMDLKSSSCRWPMGDPSDPNFRYCGARSNVNETYCAAHAEIAFPARSRSKRG